MSAPTPPRLSQLLDTDRLGGATDRRGFLARAGALSLAIPGIGAALAGCSPESADSSRSAQSTGASAASPQGTGEHNSDSRLDSAMLKGQHHGTTSATPDATQGA